ncbi:MAG: RidA family protein [Geminicoccaceae bacterium]|nr:RidA family protein [Geminicoccaceae bacterium]MCS7267506.1 RidA family protein [Geminicoccaceae bacterium]MCX7630673.1 RidA family protein [Geminicoccaceae bacterium]MDW8123710.1 RidA family protein [Geminicoccaceae bacterium]MDW8342011.1 RidA family protein [Geminicoccaceae bacterium]
MSIERIEPGKRLSQAVVFGDLVILAGQVAVDKPGASMAEQTRNVLERIDALLAKAGTDKSKILSANIWIADMRQFDEMNRVWDAWVPEGCAPARATVEARLASPDYCVEIMVVAAR